MPKDPKEPLTEVSLTTPKVVPSTPKKRGRPKKSLVDSKKTGNRGKMGRPVGDAGIMQEYKARMLASPKSKKVIEAIFDAALDNDHKHQSAAWKIVADRILPVAVFEQEVVKGAGKNRIEINITGLTGTTSTPVDFEEGAFTE